VRALLAGDWQVTGGVLKITRRIREVGVPSWPVTGRHRSRIRILLIFSFSKFNEFYDFFSVEKNSQKNS